MDKGFEQINHDKKSGRPAPEDWEKRFHEMFVSSNVKDGWNRSTYEDGPKVVKDFIRAELEASRREGYLSGMIARGKVDPMEIKSEMLDEAFINGCTKERERIRGIACDVMQHGIASRHCLCLENAKRELLAKFNDEKEPN